jgi:hypothetical protein
MNNKVVFYASVERNFRSTLLGYLVELQNSENIEIVLLHEHIDSDLLDFLKNKKFFPRIVEFVYIGQYDRNLTSNIRQFREISELANEIIIEYLPAIIITSSDFHSIFELFLCRAAKRFNIKIISIACSNSVGEMKKISKWISLYSINTKFKFVSPFLALLFYSFRKYAAHFSVHYIFPFFSGNLPFFGKSSFLLYRGQSGMRDATYQIVFSEQEKLHFQHSGVPSSKLITIRHPYYSDSIKTIIKNHFCESLEIDFLLLHSAELIGFDSNDFSIISIEKRIDANIKIFNKINEYFPDKLIYIKLHPNVSKQNLDYIKNRYLNAAKNLLFINQSIPIEVLLINSKVVIDLPRPVSTSIFMNTLFNPSGISISLDLFEEFLGDYYKFNNSVQYIANIDSFVDFLISYKNQTFKSYFTYGHNQFDYSCFISFIKDKSLIV